MSASTQHTLLPSVTVGTCRLLYRTLSEEAWCTNTIVGLSPEGRWRPAPRGAEGDWRQGQAGYFEGRRPRLNFAMYVGSSPVTAPRAMAATASQPPHPLAS